MKANALVIHRFATSREAHTILAEALLPANPKMFPV